MGIHYGSGSISRRTRSEIEKLRASFPTLLPSLSYPHPPTLIPLLLNLLSLHRHPVPHPEKTDELFSFGATLSPSPQDTKPIQRSYLKNSIHVLETCGVQRFQLNCLSNTTVSKSIILYKFLPFNRKFWTLTDVNLDALS